MRLFQKSTKDSKRTEATVAQANPIEVGGDFQLVRPHITEKATDLAKKNQYVFVVRSRANKRDIARQVERKYGVNVLGVRIVNVHAKAVRLGRTKGIRTGYKKAMVHIQDGQKIEILPT